jgi:hypothetical protein
MGLGSRIRKKLIPVPDPGVKKAPDPGSATLIKILLRENLNCNYFKGTEPVFS